MRSQLRCELVVVWWMVTCVGRRYVLVGKMARQTHPNDDAITAPLPLSVPSDC